MLMPPLESEALAATERSPCVVAKNICKGFRTGKTHIEVIKDISLCLYPGDLTLIAGPSGCGKSTLIALLSSLLHPDSGQVQALGCDLTKLGDRALENFRLRHCGFIFQGFNLFPALTSLEQVMLVLKYLNLDERPATAVAQEAINLVGLTNKSHLRPLELSGGEKQRVAIARAIAKSPRLIFADEPTSSLDGQNGQVVISLLKKIAHEQHCSVVCVTHDHRLFEHGDRLVSLEDGRIVSDERQFDIDHDNSTSKGA